MLSRMKFALVSFLFAWLPLLYAAETVFIPQGSLLFKDEKAKHNWEIKATVRQDFVCEVIKKDKAFLQREKAIGFCVDVYRLNIPGMEGLSYFPDVIFKKQKNGSITPQVDKIDSLMFLGVFLFVAGLAVLAGYFHLKTERKKYLLPASLLFFFWGFASWYIGFMSDPIITPFDDIHYYNIARHMLDLNFTSAKYYYTLGFPLVCVPFVYLFHLQNWIDFLRFYMNFQTYILIPGLFLVLYWFFQKRLNLSRLQSFCILLLWLALMIFYLPMNGMIDSRSLSVAASYYGNACFRFVEQDLRFVFYHLTWLGRNSMCDYMAAFLFAVVLAFSMKKSRSLIRFFVLSAGFGFVCLIRMNYIFFAPLLAFVFYDSFAGLWQCKRNYLYAFLCGTAGFMAGFVWQLIINKIQLGSPFIWPYSLHQFSPDRGFVWGIVPYGFKCIFQSNYVYLIPGISSLFFLPDRKTRALLALWIFPTLFFFCGGEWNSPLTNSATVETSTTGSLVPIIFNNPIRFLLSLYAPLLAAVVMNPVWKTAWNIRIKAFLVVLSSCLLCKSNIYFVHFQPWNLGKYGLSNTALIVIQCAVCLFCFAVIFSMWKELKADYANTVGPFRFLIIFTLAFFLGSVCIYFAAVLVLAAIICGLRDTWLEIRGILVRATGSGEPCS